MNEQWANVLITVITTVGGIISLLLTLLIKKGMNYLDSKTLLVDSATRNHVEQRAIGIMELAAREVQQEYVDSLKAAKEDGKLTAEEIKEANERAMSKGLKILGEQALVAGQDLLKTALEAAVQRIGVEKKTAQEMTYNLAVQSPAQ